RDRAAQDRAVFLDESGARWRMVKRLCVLAVVLIVAALGWFVPWALTQGAAGAAGLGGAGTTLLDSLPDRLPVVGRGQMLRVFRVEYDGSRPYAVDPFSGDRWRALNQAEMQQIGYSSYGVDRFGQLPDKQLALTFDDGPDPRNTPELLDLLSRFGARATFFDTGENVLAHPDLFKREIREGHLIGNHTLHHVEFAKQASPRNLEELVTPDRVMRSIGGYDTGFFRLPYGGNDVEGIGANAYGILLAQQTGHYAASFDIDTDDYLYAPGRTVPLPKLDGRGHVLLMHDGGGDHAATLDLVERLLTEARAQGYTFVTMAALHPDGPAAAGPVTPSLTDRLTHWAFWSAHVLPRVLVQALFVLGAGTMAVVSVATVLLALVERRRRRRTVWDPAYRPSVTVVIAAYNEARVIGKTIASLRRSDYPGLDVLVVDDGSTDGTADVVRSIGWDGLRVISRPNGGKAAALNHALAETGSDIVVTFDADTVVRPGTVGALVRRFADARVGAVAGQVKVGNRRGLLTRWQSLEYLTAIGLDRSAQSLLGAIMVVPGACAAWRRTAVLEAGGFDSRTLAEDCDLTLSLQRAGWRIEQEHEAIALTEVPQSARSLVRQRFRWMFGTLQAVWKQRRMLLRPRYGALGLIVMPYTVLSVLVPLIFLPLAYWLVVRSVLDGDVHTVLIYLGVLTAFHLVMATVAVALMRERWWHLLVVPVYRLIYEPLRTYLLYATALAVLRGRVVGWNKLDRQGTVRFVLPEPRPPVVPVAAPALPALPALPAPRPAPVRTITPAGSARRRAG
ncbi:MAG TPA: bifunctional polysaccharide deacetylase/glycosyltransferase family 2 protein, partial [Mycobacteriales bacterium]|nr:bifunctional polysaccharide deacetylase/glycosyltransferase family 2 protein [Mycobacteriales bacterium]